MITGYNTDVEYGGVVYHVQTEDKGLQTPIILSLVYVGGAILASKRAPYNDLISAGFDQQILADRLQRQHKLICAAVHAGRIEDLKRMGERDVPPSPGREPAQPDEQATTKSESQPVEPETAPTPSPADMQEYVSDAPLDVRLMEEPEFRGGTSVTLRALVTRAADNGRAPAANVKVVVKTLSTGFSPSKVYALTDSSGLATVSLTFPRFRSGRAAVLVEVEDKALRAELRRIILPGG